MTRLLIAAMFLLQFFNLGTQYFHFSTTQVTGVSKRRNNLTNEECEQQNYYTHTADILIKEIEYRHYHKTVNVFYNSENTVTQLYVIFELVVK
mgnify:CR=1 FL=1